MDNELRLSGEVQPLKMRWVMVGLAFLATVLNYVHRLSFNYLSADGALRELIPNDAFGYIGTAFFVAYMISNAFSGFVIDKLGTRIGYALCMAFWTTAGLVHAFAVTPPAIRGLPVFSGHRRSGQLASSHQTHHRVVSTPRTFYRIGYLQQWVGLRRDYRAADGGVSGH